jgi:hypothetical protein
MALAWRGMIPLALAAMVITAIVVYLERAVGLQNGPLWILIGNVLLIVAALAVLALRPRHPQNKRVAVPNSRYNPQLAAMANAE